MSTTSNPHVQRWPNLEGVQPELANAVRLIYNGFKDHTDAIGALNDKAAPVSQPAASGLEWHTGSGNPNGVVIAPPGSLYTNTAGGAATTLWVKEAGVDANGWVAK